MAGSASRPLPSRPLLERKLEAHLRFIYPERSPEDLTAQVIEAFWPAGSGARMRPTARRASAPPWSERDAVLITYGNSLIDGEHPPLTLLHDFLKVHLRGAISSVHVLPFFPWTSDDGFSVVDYTKVNSDLGSWDHLARLGADYRLMADLVLNHVSSSSAWFTQFLQDQEPGSGYFIDVDPATDLSAVVRPRPHPLLRAVETPSGEKHVWCTFSHDQVDVNFANPDLLLEFIRIMRFHIDNGVRTIRLDAVAFVWKEIGTSCIHHPKTHEIVRLMRTLADYAHEPLVLITETNVPNFENLSYFGNRNEAHAVYNFSFPPLMVHALLTGDSTLLNRWQMRMPPAPMGCFFFNFLASHDGIGLRPAEGYLDDEAIASMIETIRGFGGLVSMRGMADGSQRPYEINVSLFDTLKGTAAAGEDGMQFERFVCSQTVMMALEGIPAFYIHSLLATPNDHERVARMGHNRSINRHQWNYPELEERLADASTDQARVLKEVLRRIRIRAGQPAFHPNATQYTLQLGPALFGLWRQSLDREQSIFAIANVTAEPQRLSLVSLNLIAGEDWTDLITGRRIDVPELTLDPYQCVWLTNRPKRAMRAR
ncbi:sugar phosphorylase [Aquibium sp. LZ166]|uniref:Sugar phosphorylase n=1 Tax=Aquibium pacificus TaxID=3153579 RepID=A0ABV3SED4_9HYPH